MEELRPSKTLARGPRSGSEQGGGNHGDAVATAVCLSTGSDEHSVQKLVSDPVLQPLQVPGVAGGVVLGNMLNAGRTLVRMNLLFPQNARWEPIYDLLDGPDIPDQIRTVATIARDPGSIPQAVIGEITARLEKLAEAQPRYAGRLKPAEGLT